MKTRLKESDSVEIIERITRSYNKAKVEQNEMYPSIGLTMVDPHL